MIAFPGTFTVPTENRERLVERLATDLRRRHSPRLTMMVVVLCAAGIGFLASAVMLWMGLRYMPVRYALASLAGYGVFLGLMNRWLGHHSRSAVVDGLVDAATPIDISDGLFRGGSRVAERAADGLFGGGRSGGAGASASFDAPGVAPPVNPAPLMLSSHADKGGSKGLSLDLDLDDGVKVLPVLAIIAIVAGLVACASVIWTAPQMMAELLVDGAVAGAAYQRLHASTRDWTFDVARRTWLPATAIIVTFVLLGIAGHYFKPGADSIGDFFS